MSDQNRNSKRPRPKKYSGDTDEEVARKRLRNNELERHRHSEQQRLVNRMDQLVPNGYKKSSHKEGSQTAIMENVVSYLSDIDNFIQNISQHMSNYVPTPMAVSGSIQQQIIQSNQQQCTETNREILQQPPPYLGTDENILPFQPPVPLLNQFELQQVQQPNLGGTTINHHPLHVMPQQSSALLPVTNQIVDIPTQQKSVIPSNTTALCIGTQQDMIAPELQRVLAAPQSSNSQTNNLMQTTTWPVKRHLGKTSQIQRSKSKLQVLRPKPSTSSGISLVQTTSAMINQPQCNINTLASSAIPLQSDQLIPIISSGQSSRHASQGSSSYHTSAMSNQPQLYVNPLASSTIPLQSSHKLIPNSHPTMSNLSQFYGNTSVTSMVPLQSSNQLMANFHSSDNPDSLISMHLPVPNEQGVSEHDWERDNPDKESSGHNSRQAPATSRGYHTSSPDDCVEIENSLTGPGADSGLRPEEQSENLAERNIDSYYESDDPVPEISLDLLEDIMKWAA